MLNTSRQGGDTNGLNERIFDHFDGNTTFSVLEYPLRACIDANARGCWVSTADTTYTYRMPASDVNVDFTLNSNRFDCDPDDGTSGPACKELSE